MAIRVTSRNQAYYSLIGRDYEWELMPLGLDQGIGAVVWSPLGWGRLTGKIRRGQPLPETSRLHKTAEIGSAGRRRILYSASSMRSTASRKKPGRSIPQVALNWLFQRPTVSSVIIGARNEQQLRRESRRRRLEFDGGSDQKARRGERDGQALSILAPEWFLGTQSAARVGRSRSYYARRFGTFDIERRSIEIVLSPRELWQEAAS